MRKNFFTLRVAEHWNNFPGRSGSLPLEMFKTHLDMFLCHLLQVILPCQGGWTG